MTSLLLTDDTASDDTAHELINPDLNRPLRPVASLPQLDFEAPAAPPAPAPTPVAEPTLHEPEPVAEPVPAKSARSRKARPAVPAWEDVLLGVRSSGGQH